MKLERLDLDQVKQIYEERMTVDFTSDELRPLERIIGPLSKGVYECLGLFDEDVMRGYVFLVKKDDDYLIDYLAVLPEHRGKGVGSNMLSLLKEYLAGAESIILEVEDPDAAEDEEDENKRLRRLSFYKRNGFLNTGVTMMCFNVPYLILSLGKHRGRIGKIEETYYGFYRMILPKDMFDQNIHRVVKVRNTWNLIKGLIFKR